MVSGNLPSTLEKAGGPLGVSWTRVALLTQGQDQGRWKNPGSATVWGQSGS